MPTTTTFYSGPGDGQVNYLGAGGGTWATTHNAANGTANGISADEYLMARYFSTVYTVYRMFQIVDTSALPDDAVISSATVGFWGLGSGGTDPRHYNIYSSTAGDTLANSDYQSCGTTAFSDTSVAHSAWTTGSYNTWAMNATGIAAISKTGKTKFSIREADKDVANTAPAVDVNNYVHGQTSAYTGATRDPYLSVTYTVVKRRGPGGGVAYGGMGY